MKEKNGKFDLREFFRSEVSRCPRLTYDSDRFQNLALTSEEAFALIPEALDIAITQEDAYLIEAAADLLEKLARLSQTTEMPEELRQRWDDLIAHLAVAASQESMLTIDIDYLRRWYRMPTKPC